MQTQFEPAYVSIKQLGFTPNDLRMTISNTFDLATDFEESLYPDGFSAVNVEFFLSKDNKKEVIATAELFLLDSAYFGNTDIYRPLSITFNIAYYATLASVKIFEDDFSLQHEDSFENNNYKDFPEQPIELINRLVHDVESADFGPDTLPLFGKVAYLSNLHLNKQLTTESMAQFFFNNLLTILTNDTDFDYLLINPNFPISDPKVLPYFLATGGSIFDFFTSFECDASFGKLKNIFPFPTLVFDVI